MSRCFLKILNFHLPSINFDSPIRHTIFFKLLSPFSSNFIFNPCLFIQMVIIILYKLFHVTVDLVSHHHCWQKIDIDLIVLVFGRIKAISIMLILGVILKTLCSISRHIDRSLVFSYHFKFFISMSRVDHIVFRLDITFVFFNVCPIVWIIHCIQIILVHHFRVHSSLLRILLSHSLNRIGGVNPHLAAIQTWMREGTTKCKEELLLVLWHRHLLRLSHLNFISLISLVNMEARRGGIFMFKSLN